MNNYCPECYGQPQIDGAYIVDGSCYVCGTSAPPVDPLRIPFDVYRPDLNGSTARWLAERLFAAAVLIGAAVCLYLFFAPLVSRFMSWVTH